MAVVGTLFSLPISKPVWDALPLLHAVTFPWRALAIVAFAASAAAGVAFRHLPLTATALAVVLGLPLAMPQSYLDDVVNERFTPTRIARQNLRPGTPGYLDVRGASDEAWHGDRVRILDGDARLESSSTRTDRSEATIVAATAARIQFDVTNFPGWMATV